MRRGAAASARTERRPRRLGAVLHDRKIHVVNELRFQPWSVTLAPPSGENDPALPRLIAKPSASGWALASLATVGASGAMIMSQPPAHYGFVQEVAHTQEIHPGPIDFISGALLATTLLAIGVVRFRDTFRFSCSLDGSEPQARDP